LAVVRTDLAHPVRFPAVEYQTQGAAMTNRICKKCDESIPLNHFRMAGGYRDWTCNSCRSMRVSKQLACKRNRLFNALVSWRA
jgi:hypothetical protein